MRQGRLEEQTCLSKFGQAGPTFGRPVLKFVGRAGPKVWRAEPQFGRAGPQVGRLRSKFGRARSEVRPARSEVRVPWPAARPPQSEGLAAPSKV